MRVALAQINPTIGDFDLNANLIRENIARAREAAADLIVFPELALCGYPPRDLLLHQGFLEACAAAAKSIGETATASITAVFGVPLPAEPSLGLAGGIHNSLLVYRNNAYVDYYDKRLLPTYDVFDEDRYFVPGSRCCIIDVPCRDGSTSRVGLAICEDLWKGEDVGFSWRYRDEPDPMDDLARAKPDLIVAASASPFVLGKGKRHREILRKRAAQSGSFVASVNQLGGNDDLVFDGHACIFDPAGKLIAAAPGFIDHLLIHEVPRRDSGARLAAVIDPVEAPPEQLLYGALVLGVRDYLRKTGFRTALLGLSGGIDSALTAVIGVAALGRENLTGFMLPSLYSSDHSLADAADLAARLGIRCLKVPIEPPMKGFREILNPAFESISHAALGAKLPDLTEENLQSRIRGTLLMAASNRTGAIVLTTGNKSELAVGYCTLYGDMNGGLAVLSDVNKEQVYALSRWINENHSALGFKSPPIPQRSIDKAPSAELRPDQKDQDSLPEYPVLDEILERYVERRQSPSTIAAETRLDEALVRKIARMIDLSEYKRRQAAVGLKVTSVAFGTGRRVPIAQRWRP